MGYNLNETEEKSRSMIYDKGITSYISAKAREIPQQQAVICENKAVTYHEILSLSSNFVTYFQSMQIEKGDIIGVSMKRSERMLAVMIALLELGAAYLPLDAGYPMERKKYLISNSGMKRIIVDDSTAGEYPQNSKKINTDHLIPEPGINTAFGPGAYDGEDLAYIIYTSGSTGNPKGVMIEHNSIVNLMNAMEQIIGARNGKKILSATQACFDIFLVESLISLALGFTIILATEREQKNPRLLSKLIVKNDVEFLQMTPSTICFLRQTDPSLSSFSNVKQIIVTGEMCPQSLLETLQKETEAQILDLYGPTETTVYATAGDLTNKDRVDIGVPILNTDIIIADDDGHLVEPGVPGELWISGTGLARGYLNAPELTEKQFVYEKASGRRAYKTGDLVRMQEDGCLEFLRRKDNQVKIRGYRIETGEIENTMLGHPQIRQAAVLTETDNETPYLCAYFVSDICNESALMEYLKKKLPEYMLPAYLVKVNEMPVNFNGKINRSELKEMAVSSRK